MESSTASESSNLLHQTAQTANKLPNGEDNASSLQEQKIPDRRKTNPRSEKQKDATARMMAARHANKQHEQKTAGKLELSQNYDPDNIAIAELWYSNHELAKENRRKRKMDDMEKLISNKLDSYHAKLMEELQKPLSGFLDRYIDLNMEDLYDEEKSSSNKDAAEQKQEKKAPIPQPVESATTRRAAPIDKKAYFKPSANNRNIDFSRFF